MSRLKQNVLIALAIFAVLAIVRVVHAATPQLTVTWTAPSNYVDGTAIGTAAITYQLYAGASGKEVKLGNPVTSPPYVISPTPAPGVTECVQVTAIVNGVESAKTPEACGTIPYPAPNTPTVVTITIK